MRLVPCGTDCFLIKNDVECVRLSVFTGCQLPFFCSMAAQQQQLTSPVSSCGWLGSTAFVQSCSTPSVGTWKWCYISAEADQTGGGKWWLRRLVWHPFVPRCFVPVCGVFTVLTCVCAFGSWWLCTGRVWRFCLIAQHCVCVSYVCTWITGKKVCLVLHIHLNILVQPACIWPFLCMRQCLICKCQWKWHTDRGPVEASWLWTKHISSKQTCFCLVVCCSAGAVNI